MNTPPVRLFGTTLRETVGAFTGRVWLGKKHEKKSSAKHQRMLAIMRFVVSIVLIAVATVLVLNGHTDVGAGILGAVTGYWVK